MNGKDIMDIFNLGASGVQMGSIFVPTDECDASNQFKQTYVNASDKDIVIIDSPVGMPGRAFDGSFIQRVKQGLMKPKNCAYHCIKTCDYTKSPYCIMKALYNAAMGNTDKGYVFAGARAYLSKKITSVKDVITSLKEEYNSCRSN